MSFSFGTESFKLVNGKSDDQYDSRSMTSRKIQVASFGIAHLTSATLTSKWKNLDNFFSAAVKNGFPHPH